MTGVVKRISTRFALLMAAAAVLPLLSFGAVSIVSVRSGAEEAVVEGNLNVAHRAAEQIALYVTGSVRIVKGVASNLQQTSLQPWQQDRILKNFVLEFPEFTELTLLNERGQALVSSRIGASSVSVPGPDSISVEGALMSPFSVDNDLLPAAVLALRLTDPESPGWLVGRLSLEELWRMVDSIRVGERGYALVVTSEGQLLAHGDPAAKSRVARGDNMLTHPLLAALGKPGIEDSATAEYVERHGAMVGVAARVPVLGWTVIVEQPQAEAYVIASRMQRQLAIAISIALIAMLVAGYYWGHKLIDPILALTRGTRALAEGRLNERVVIGSTDELGQLGTAFNNMADRLIELQEDVRKKERQAMFGRIAVGLVHDLSHPIQNIGNSCKLMVRMYDDAEYRDSFRRTVDRELSAVKRVLEDLRNIARPLPLERFPIDINKALAELVDTMQSSAEHAGVALEAELCFGPLYIDGDLFALNRVYRNLLMNAFQATPPRGRVVIRTMRRDDLAIVEVADTGSGIPADRLDTIFESFVTTKRRGLGLGLAMAKKVVEQLGGTISVASDVGRGSTFTLRFPLTSARPSSQRAG